ncbi:hypothetical protein OUZ56_027932 [Daphnia magna]|uniref:Uncharacterized protein n=1 Tax=Daphnia magna TaxID=35525 RepID=A0ABR0B2D3_9CRUS|nr:hypothetical protein OUZ56_027932 [Daphnia magna]
MDSLCLASGNRIVQDLTANSIKIQANSHDHGGNKVMDSEWIGERKRAKSLNTHNSTRSSNPQLGLKLSARDYGLMDSKLYIRFTIF